GFVVLFAVAALIKWLGARGHLMFLDGLATGNPTVSEAWAKTSTPGNSLWRVYLALFAITYMLGILIAIPFLLSLPSAMTTMTSDDFFGFLMIRLIVVVLIFSPVIIILGIVKLFIDDFMVPIMWRHDLVFVSAWARFKPLLMANIGDFVIYLLARIGIAIV